MDTFIGLILAAGCIVALVAIIKYAKEDQSDEEKDDDNTDS